jgi:hypothetical protein
MGVRASSFLTLNRRSLKKHKKSTPVVIRGIVPGSPAALTKQLEEGDEIVRVNGQNVTIKNIEMILSVITDEVVFEIHKNLRESPLKHATSPPPSFETSDVMSPYISLSPPHSPSPATHLVMYLTMDIKETDSPEKV